MSRLHWIAGFALASLASAQGAVHGTIAEDTTWSGRVDVDGDVEVAAGATLRIKAGTVVAIAKKDTTGSGWNGAAIEFHVKGRLQVNGTEKEPVRFAVGGEAPVAPASKPATERDAKWHGIVLHGAEEEVRDRDTIRHAVFVGARAALQVPRDGPQIYGCVFLSCTIGIEVGSAYRNQRDWGAKSGVAQPEIERCRFARCGTAVYAEVRGSPELRRAVVYGCGTGVGNVRIGVTRSLDEPGAVIDHCAFIENGTAVVGQSFVRDSIFLGNNVAAKLSAFHDANATSVDHVALQANVFWGNKRLTVGDTGLDNAAVIVDPGLVGPLSELGKLGTALPKCLELRGDSKARGRAAYGGDPGPLGRTGSNVSAASWNASGEVLGDLLVLPFEAGDVNKPFRTAPGVGKAEGRRWWAMALTDEAGIVNLSEVFGSREAWVVLPVRVTRAGEVAFEINADFAQLEIWWDGQRVETWDERRRFGTTGRLYKRQATAGSHLLALHVVSWGNERRLGISVHGGVRSAVRKKKAGALKLASVKVRRERDGTRVLEAKLTDVVHWADDGKFGGVVVLDADGNPLEGGDKLNVEITGRKQLRVPGIPAEWGKELQVRLGAMRGAAGQAADQKATKTIR